MIDKSLNTSPAFNDVGNLKARNLFVKQGVLFFNFTEPYVLPGDTKGCILGYVKDDELKCMDREAVLLNKDLIKVVDNDVYYITNNYLLKKYNGQESKEIAKQISVFEVKDKVVYHDYLRRLNIENDQGHLDLPVGGFITSMKTFPDNNIYAYKILLNGANEIIRVIEGKLESKPWVTVSCKIAEFLTTKKYGLGVSKECGGVFVYYPKYKQYATVLKTITYYYLSEDNKLFLGGRLNEKAKLTVLDLETGKEKEVMDGVDINQVSKIDTDIYYVGRKDNKQVVGIVGKESKEIESYMLLKD